MIYALFVVMWLTGGDTAAIARTYPTQAECDTAKANAVEAAKAAGSVESMRAVCVPVSNPSTERAS